MSPARTPSSIYVPAVKIQGPALNVSENTLLLFSSELLHMSAKSMLNDVIEDRIQLMVSTSSFNHWPDGEAPSMIQHFFGNHL